jgi:hypothetical protein
MLPLMTFKAQSLRSHAPYSLIEHINLVVESCLLRLPCIIGAYLVQGLLDGEFADFSHIYSPLLKSKRPATIFAPKPQLCKSFRLQTPHRQPTSTPDSIIRSGLESAGLRVDHRSHPLPGQNAYSHLDSEPIGGGVIDLSQCITAISRPSRRTQPSARTWYICWRAQRSWMLENSKIRPRVCA